MVPEVGVPWFSQSTTLPSPLTTASPYHRLRPLPTPVPVPAGVDPHLPGNYMSDG